MCGKPSNWSTPRRLPFRTRSGGSRQENFISILLGENPCAIVRGKPLVDQPHSLEVPAGIPSSLLERRPDIRQAEQELVAANAQIGVDNADYFPQIH
jgi:multidrug efflux system outer membrane protein